MTKAQTDEMRAQLREFAATLKVGLDPSMDMRVTYSQPKHIGVGYGFPMDRFSPEAINERINLGRNLYFCVGACASSFYEDDPKKEKVWRRRKQDIRAGLLVGLDDIGTKSNVPLEFFTETLPPTAVVETSPGNYQVLYFFDRPIFDIPYFQDVLRSIILPLHERYGIDHLADIDRVLRLPFGANTKCDELTGFRKYPEDWRVRLVSFDPSARYLPETIAAAYGLDIVRTPAQSSERRRAGGATEEPERAEAFRMFVDAERAAGRLGKSASSKGGEKYRCRCPFEGEHATSSGDTAWVADPIEADHGVYTFDCRSGTCQEAKTKGLRTFDAAMTEAGIDMAKLRREYAEKQDKEAAANNADWLDADADVSWLDAR